MASLGFGLKKKNTCGAFANDVVTTPPLRKYSSNAAFPPRFPFTHFTTENYVGASETKHLPFPRETRFRLPLPVVGLPYAHVCRRVVHLGVTRCPMSVMSKYHWGKEGEATLDSGEKSRHEPILARPRSPRSAGELLLTEESQERRLLSEGGGPRGACRQPLSSADTVPGSSPGHCAPSSLGSCSSLGRAEPLPFPQP